MINEPPYTRPVCTVVWEAHSVQLWTEPSTRCVLWDVVRHR